MVYLTSVSFSTDTLLDENLTSCLFVLENEPTIARAYLFTLHFINDISFLISKEMHTIKYDILYWQSMSKMDPFYSATYKIYINSYRRIYNFKLLNFLSNLPSKMYKLFPKNLFIKNSDNNDQISRTPYKSPHYDRTSTDPTIIDIENVDQNIIVLNKHFLLLASILSLITEASYELKLVISEVHDELPYYIENGRIIFFDDKIDKCLAISR